MTRKQELQKAADDLELSVIYDDKNECSLFPDGSSVTCCTSGAILIAKAFGGKVFGYACRDNPTATAGIDCFGHDFAVVDNRYVVDYWMQYVDCGYNAAVFDMEDPHDRALVESFYGDRNKWEAGYDPAEDPKLKDHQPDGCHLCQKS